MTYFYATLCVPAAVVWWLLWKRLPVWSVPEDPAIRFRGGDACFAAGLAVYFISLMFQRPPGDFRLTGSVLLTATIIFAGLAGVVVSFLVMRKLSPVRIFGLRPARPLMIIGVAALCLTAAFPIVELLSGLVTWGGKSATDEDSMVQLFRGDASTAARVAAVLFAVIVAPVWEEFMFRGYLYGVTRQFCGRFPAAVVSAILFAAMHPNLPALPALFALGLAFVVAYELTGSLLASMAMHSLFNSLNLIGLLFFSGPQS